MIVGMPTCRNTFRHRRQRDDRLRGILFNELNKSLFIEVFEFSLKDYGLTSGLFFNKENEHPRQVRFGRGDES